MLDPCDGCRNRYGKGRNGICNECINGHIKATENKYEPEQARKPLSRNAEMAFTTMLTLPYVLGSKYK